MTYQPENYWEKRLAGKLNLSGVGHQIFNQFYNHFLYKAKVRSLEKALRGKDIQIIGKSICDIGCGTGFFVDFFYNRGARNIVGIDITNSSITYLKSRYPQYQFTKDDVSSPTLTNNINTQFDIVNVFDVLYHIMDEDSFITALVNIYNLTDDNGYIFLTDSLYPKKTSSGEHVRFRGVDIYKKFFEEKGLNLICVNPLYYLLNQPIFGAINISCVQRVGIQLDNLLAPIYFILDNFLLSCRNNNLCLFAIQKSVI
jgi:SAM-dependent methyltransferase